MSLTLLLVGMFVATYTTRASFLVFGHRLRFPRALQSALRHVPVAVLSAILVPAALAPGGQLQLDLHNAWLYGTLAAGLVARFRGKLLPALLTGFAVFAALRLWVH